MTDLSDKKSIDDLLSVMAALRTPVTGCPWDLEQNFATIAPYTLEEAYEVADAIERDDRADLNEELGDLLLQVVYHARMAEEEGSFAFADVVDSITRKMIRRHPHVFGDDLARSAGAAKGFWEQIKAAEKAARAGRGKPVGLLDDVPVGMPGLTRALKLQAKAATVGFDWPGIAPVLDKLREELAELEQAVTQETPARQAEELGDLLFVAANIARHLGIDPEAAVRGANAKFTRRFAHIEARLDERGRKPSESNLAEMDELWNEARAADKSGG